MALAPVTHLAPQDHKALEPLKIEEGDQDPSPSEKSIDCFYHAVQQNIENFLLNRPKLSLAYYFQVIKLMIIPKGLSNADETIVVRQLLSSPLLSFLMHNVPGNDFKEVIRKCLNVSFSVKFGEEEVQEMNQYTMMRTEAHLWEEIAYHTPDGTDVRHHLFFRLIERCDQFFKAQKMGWPTYSASNLQAVRTTGALFIEEVVRKIDFLFRMEAWLKHQELPPGVKVEALVENLINTVKEAALKRHFAVPAPDLEEPVSHRLQSTELMMAQAIDFMSKFPSLKQSFQKLNEDIGGMEELKMGLFFDLFLSWLPQAVKEYGVTAPNGILFYGAPGCGKTHICKAITRASGRPTFEYSEGKQGSPLINQTALNIQKVFDEARQKAPSFIYVDEASSVFPNRATMGPQSSHKEEDLNQFLRNMESAGREGVVVIAATNYPNRMDPAVLRSGRFDKKFHIPIPDHFARKEMFKLYLKKIAKVDPNIDYNQLAHATQGYVSSDIRLIVDDVCRTAAREQSTIEMADLADKIQRSRPSVTPETVATFEAMKRQFEE